MMLSGLYVKLIHNLCSLAIDAHKLRYANSGRSGHPGYITSNTPTE